MQCIEGWPLLVLTAFSQSRWEEDFNGVASKAQSQEELCIDMGDAAMNIYIYNYNNYIYIYIYIRHPLACAHELFTLNRLNLWTGSRGLSRRRALDVWHPSLK